jgi:hypothetical protein
LEHIAKDFPFTRGRVIAEEYWYLENADTRIITPVLRWLGRPSRHSFPLLEMPNSALFSEISQKRSRNVPLGLEELLSQGLRRKKNKKASANVYGDALGEGKGFGLEGMGISKLRQDLMPYAEDVCVGHATPKRAMSAATPVICKVVIDGPALVYSVCARLSPRSSSSVAGVDAQPSYTEINRGVAELLAALNTRQVDMFGSHPLRPPRPA